MPRILRGLVHGAAMDERGSTQAVSSTPRATAAANASSVPAANSDSKSDGASSSMRSTRASLPSASATQAAPSARVRMRNVLLLDDALELPAVDADHGPRHIRRPVTAQERRHVRVFLWAA